MSFYGPNMSGYAAYSDTRRQAPAPAPTPVDSGDSPEARTQHWRPSPGPLAGGQQQPETYQQWSRAHSVVVRPNAFQHGYHMPPREQVGPVPNGAPAMAHQTTAPPPPPTAAPQSFTVSDIANGRVSSEWLSTIGRGHVGQGSRDRRHQQRADSAPYQTVSPERLARQGRQGRQARRKEEECVECRFCGESVANPKRHAERGCSENPDREFHFCPRPECKAVFTTKDHLKKHLQPRQKCPRAATKPEQRRHDQRRARELQQAGPSNQLPASAGSSDDAHAGQDHALPVVQAGMDWEEEDPFLTFLSPDVLDSINTGPTETEAERRLQEDRDLAQGVIEECRGVVQQAPADNGMGVYSLQDAPAADQNTPQAQQATNSEGPTHPIVDALPQAPADDSTGYSFFGDTPPANDDALPPQQSTDTFDWSSLIIADPHAPADFHGMGVYSLQDVHAANDNALPVEQATHTHDNSTGYNFLEDAPATNNDALLLEQPTNTFDWSNPIIADTHAPTNYLSMGVYSLQDALPVPQATPAPGTGTGYSFLDNAPAANNNTLPVPPPTPIPITNTGNHPPNNTLPTNDPPPQAQQPTPTFGSFTQSTHPQKSPHELVIELYQACGENITEVQKAVDQFKRIV